MNRLNQSWISPRLFSVAAVAILALAAGCNRYSTASPKDTAKSIAKAMDNHADKDVFAKLVTGSDKAPEMMAKMADMRDASKDYESALDSKFGADTSKDKDSNAKFDEFDTSKIDSATESIDGDKATLDIKDGATLHFKKIGSDWRLDASDMGPAADSSDLIDKMTEAYKSETSNVKSGKYDSRKKANDALGVALFSGMAAGSGH